MNASKVIRMQLTKRRLPAVWERGGYTGISIDSEPVGIGIVWANPDGMPYRPYFIQDTEPNDQQALVPVENGSWMVVARQWHPGRFNYEVCQVTDVRTDPDSYGLSLSEVFQMTDGEPDYQWRHEWLSCWSQQKSHGHPQSVISAVPITLKAAIDAALAKCQCPGCREAHYVLPRKK